MPRNDTLRRTYAAHDHFGPAASLNLNVSHELRTVTPYSRASTRGWTPSLTFLAMDWRVV
jgi:hypothetical protein